MATCPRLSPTACPGVRLVPLPAARQRCRGVVPTEAGTRVARLKRRTPQPGRRVQGLPCVCSPGPVQGAAHCRRAASPAAPRGQGAPIPVGRGGARLRERGGEAGPRVGARVSPALRRCSFPPRPSLRRLHHRLPLPRLATRASRREEGAPWEWRAGRQGRLRGLPVQVVWVAGTWASPLGRRPPGDLPPVVPLAPQLVSPPWVAGGGGAVGPGTEAGAPVQAAPALLSAEAERQRAAGGHCRRVAVVARRLRRRGGGQAQPRTLPEHLHVCHVISGARRGGLSAPVVPPVARRQLAGVGSAGMRTQVRVYTGPGASERCVAYTVEALQSELDSYVTVSPITHTELLGPSRWERDTGASVASPPSSSPRASPPCRHLQRCLSCLVARTCRIARR